MADREHLLASIEQIDQVYRYVKGEHLFPIQDPALESGYLNAVGEYFNFTRAAITDPKVIALIKKSRLIPSNFDNPDKSIYFIAFNQSPPSYGLALNPEPRLVYHVQQFMGRYESKHRETKDRWQESISGLVSQDGHQDWIFDHRGYFFSAYRTLGALDLKDPKNLATFVQGVRSTFSTIIDVAEKEAAEKFNGIRDPEEVRTIIEALNEANGILAKVLK